MLGSSLVLWFDTFSHLRDFSRGTTPPFTNVAVGPGTGGTLATYAWDFDLTAADNGLNVIVPTATPRTGQSCPRPRPSCHRGYCQPVGKCGCDRKSVAFCCRTPLRPRFAAPFRCDSLYGGRFGNAKDQDDPAICSCTVSRGSSSHQRLESNRDSWLQLRRTENIVSKRCPTDGDRRWL
jgi:hypothetical protein